MNFHVMTLFPEMINQAMNTSIFGRAMEKGLITLNAVDIREYSEDKHRRVDDYPYGGGAGMVMTPGPVYRTYEAITSSIQQHAKDTTKKPRVIYLTPQGKVFNQCIAKELAKEEELIFLCGHYEGIDERVLEMIVTDNVSIGDYVLTGGELPVMVMMDVISRLIPGVLNNELSAESESFQDDLLEYPQYTRPEEFMEKKVPEVLLSGHHANIEKFRLEQSILRTKHNRPDLYERTKLMGEID
jgi:tRNA (guanine37-N1)-methyltransferase